MDKETQRKLDLLSALQAGGVDNWDGYDFATEEYQKTIRREEALEDIVDRVFEEISEYIDECGEYYLSDEGREVFGRVLLSRANELKELCDD